MQPESLYWINTPLKTFRSTSLEPALDLEGDDAGEVGEVEDFDKEGPAAMENPWKRHEKQQNEVPGRKFF